MLVSPPPSPPPRGESARGSAAAAIFPPLRTHGARGRNAVAQPPSSLSPGKGPPCRRRCPPAPAFAADSARQAPGSGPRCRPGARPGAAAALAFCFLRSGAPAPARALQGTQRAPPAGPGKTAARARAPARQTPPSSSPRARPLGCAPAPPGGREGRWQACLREGRTSLLAYPPGGRKRRGGGRAETREECTIWQGWGQLCGRWCVLPSRQSDPGRGRVRSAHLRDYRAPGRHVWGV